MCNEIKSMQPAGQHARHSIVSARVTFETIENSILSPAKKKDLCTARLWHSSGVEGGLAWMGWSSMLLITMVGAFPSSLGGASWGEKKPKSPAYISLSPPVVVHSQSRYGNKGKEQPAS